MTDASLRFTDDLVVVDQGWKLVETGWDADRAAAVGSNFMVGNGYLGYRATAPEQRADDFVALVVSDTYDCADGRWRELTTAPNPLFVEASVAGRVLAASDAPMVESWLDLRLGAFGQRVEHDVDGVRVTVTVERIAGLDVLHLLAQRWTITADADLAINVRAGIDTVVWNLNGVHLPDVDIASSGGIRTAVGDTAESGVTVAVACTTTWHGSAGDQAQGNGPVQLTAGEPFVVDTIAAVSSSNDGADPLARVVSIVERSAARGFDELRSATRMAWQRIWARTDVRIEGSPLDDAALRFSAYHNRICTPTHTDRLPIGARGLSCQAYQGAAFWDQEVYNLPPHLFTDPDVARNILVYRHRTLDGARRKAARLGYDGAYYAWISGETGDELCPDVFFVDVLTGRPIRNHFNVWQMHVAPDVVTTIARYVAVTGDVDFVLDHGAEIAFEVARFLRSFVRYDEWREVYHCIRLLGPDEWHENVDDNAFTNHQTHAALTFAIDTFEAMAADHPERLADLQAQLTLTDDEIDGWRRVRDRLLLPEPDPSTKLIEQFAGFFDLEDIRPEQLRERLLDPSEYWGWPNGIAVRTQVSKQADVAMLLWLHARRFDDATARANYEYYEPRCSHNSSLSHAGYGMVAARFGDTAAALEHFRATARVDLLNTNHAVVAGTFIGGIHTAACAGTQQLAVNGFGGLEHRDGRLVVDPRLPADWTALTYPVTYRGRRLHVTVSHDAVTVTADANNGDAVALVVRGTTIDLDPGCSETISV